MNRRSLLSFLPAFFLPRRAQSKTYPKVRWGDGDALMRDMAVRQQAMEMSVKQLTEMPVTVPPACQADELVAAMKAGPVRDREFTIRKRVVIPDGARVSMCRFKMYGDGCFVDRGAKDASIMICYFEGMECHRGPMFDCSSRPSISRV